MPQSLSQLYVHLVFSTKNRQQLIYPKIAADLYAYMATVFHDECRSTARLIGGIEDHIHTLFNLARTWCVADVVEAVKTSTSKWMKTQDPLLRQFAWQSGYAVLSVDPREAPGLRGYIHRQADGCSGDACHYRSIAQAGSSSC